MRKAITRLLIGSIVSVGAVVGSASAMAGPDVPPGCYAYYDANGNCLFVACPREPNPFRRCDGSDD